MISIDPHQALPLYQQIAGELRARIRAGVYPPGEQLPTVRELGDALGLNFNTVARAYRLLETEGEVISRQGQGTFVEGPVVEAGRAAASLETLTTEYLRAAHVAGYSPHEVQWEFSGALRSWIQYGEPAS
jgi:DNA-binding transcriptional regulator YhcF (GntR family)